MSANCTIFARCATRANDRASNFPPPASHFALASTLWETRERAKFGTCDEPGHRQGCAPRSNQHPFTHETAAARARRAARTREIRYIRRCDSLCIKFHQHRHFAEEGESCDRLFPRFFRTFRFPDSPFDQLGTRSQSDISRRDIFNKTRIAAAPE